MTGEDVGKTPITLAVTDAMIDRGGAYSKTVYHRHVLPLSLNGYVAW